MQDFSFLRLKPTFAEAKQMGDQKQSDPNLRGYDCIRLHPLEHYCQTTNSEVDIVFNNDYKVSIIDCAENELLDITQNITIAEFVNQKTGIQNISFEIVNIGKSFTGENVFLKLQHTTGIEVFYSNAFQISDENVRETIRLCYTDYDYYEGIDYENAPYIQSIRVAGEIQEPQDDTDSSNYKQQSGNVVSKRNIYTEFENVLFPNINPLTYRALSRALKSGQVWIDGYRSTDLPQLKNGETKGNTNLSDAESKIYRDFNDKLDDSLQLSTVFNYVELSPIGNINDEIIETQPIRLVFNKPTSIGTGFLRIYRSNGTEQARLTTNDFIQINSTTFESTANLEDYIVTNLSYYNLIDSGLFLSDIGETISITSNTEWQFIYSEGYYNENYYNENYYLT